MTVYQLQRISRIKQYGREITCSEFGRLMEEAVLAYFRIVFWHSSCETVAITTISILVNIETGIPQTQVRGITIWANLLGAIFIWICNNSCTKAVTGIQTTLIKRFWMPKENMEILTLPRSFRKRHCSSWWLSWINKKVWKIKIIYINA
jgi:hypothetical protein